MPIFATKLLTTFFTHDELTDQTTNVLGRLTYGNNGAKKKALDPVKIDQIKKIVLSYERGDRKVLDQIWKNSVHAMNKKFIYKTC